MPRTIRGFTAFASELAFEASGFDADHFEGLARLEADNFWFVARNDLVAWAVGTYFPGSRSIHEVGCGTGFVLSALRRAVPEARISASDVLVNGLAFAARRHPGVALYQADAHRIPFREEFDLVGAFDVLEHLDDDSAALRAIHDSLRPKGGLLLTVPQHPRLWSAQDEIASHRRRYVAADLLAKVRAAGFQPLRATSFVSMLLPAMFAARLRQRSPSERDGVEALTVAAPLDRAMRAVLAIERNLIKRGITFPAGGSLLVAAQRVT